MIRATSFSLFVLLFSASTARADGAVDASAATQPDLIAVDRLTNLLKIRAHAENFTALLDLTKPKIIWNTRDMLWIQHDAAGKPIFAMNRAYRIQFNTSAPACYLFESQGYFLDDGDNVPDFLYTRCIDLHPLVVARDPDRGVIYQARWISAPLAGSGHITQTRNIFLLCDAKHCWRFIEEGPIADFDQLGAGECITGSIDASARWTSDPAHPVVLSYTLLTCTRWFSGGSDLPDDSITVRQKLIPAPLDTGGFQNPSDAADYAPGAFKPDGPKFVIATRNESVDSLVRRWIHDRLLSHNTLVQNAALIESSKTLLRRSNLWLNDEVVRNQTIILPSLPN